MKDLLQPCQLSKNTNPPLSVLLLDYIKPAGSDGNALRINMCNENIWVTMGLGTKHTLTIYRTPGYVFYAKLFNDGRVEGFKG